MDDWSLTVSGRELRDKIAGAVYGFVIGDAVRAITLSFSGRSQSDCLRDVADAICDSSSDSDDESQMTWCITKALVECSDLDGLEAPRFKQMVAEEFVRWHDSHGTQAVSILNDGIEKYRKLHQFIAKVDESFGSKVLVRAMPCAVIGREDLNLAQADITYPCDSGHRIIQMYSKLLQSYLMGIYPYEGSKCLRCHLEASEGHGKSIDRVHNIISSLAQMSSKSTLKECVAKTVSSSRSSPEVALAACSLIGARFGLKQIPPKWIGKLDIKWKYKAGTFINFATKFLTNLHFDVYKAL